VRGTGCMVIDGAFLTGGSCASKSTPHSIAPSTSLANCFNPGFLFDF